MSWLNFIGIASALADTSPPAAPTTQGSILSILPMLVVFVLIFYFFMFRPQSKRTREHKSLISELAVGDEVVTTGGLVGRVSRVNDNFIVLATGKNAEVIIQKNAISSVLPKGTMDSL